MPQKAISLAIHKLAIANQISEKPSDKSDYDDEFSNDDSTNKPCSHHAQTQRTKIKSELEKFNDRTYETNRVKIQRQQEIFQRKKKAKLDAFSDFY